MFSIDITLVKGLNTVFFAEHLILDGDIIVFFLLESNIIEVIQKDGNVVEFFEEETFSGSPTTSLYNVAFKARVFAVSVTYFQLTIPIADFQGKQSVNWISFNGFTADKQAFFSNSKLLFFPNITPSMYFSEETTTVVNDICLLNFKVPHVENAFVRITTLNSSVMLPSGTELSAISFALETLPSYSPQEGSIGQSLIFKKPGFYIVDVFTVVEEVSLTKSSYNVTVYPSVDDFVITVSTNVTYKLVPVTFSASYNTSFDDLNFIWDFGEGTVWKGRSNLQTVFRFVYPGNHTIQLTMHTKFYKRIISTKILVLEGFHLSLESQHVRVNQSFNSTLSVLIPYIQYLNTSIINNVTLKFDDYPNAEESTLNQTISFRQVCTEVGIQLIRVQAHSLSLGNPKYFIASHIINCYEDITDLQIIVLPGALQVISNHFTISASTSSSNFGLNFTWSSPTFKLSNQMNHKVNVMGDSLGSHTIDLIVGNPLGDTVSTQKNLTISVGITHLEIRNAFGSSFKSVGEPWLFTVKYNTTSSRYSFVVTEPIEGIGFITQDENFNVTFTREGWKTLTVNVFLDGSFENCKAASTVSCQANITNLYALLPILDPVCFYYNFLNEEVVMEPNGAVLQNGSGVNFYINVTGGRTLKHNLYIECANWNFTLHKEQFNVPFTASFWLPNRFFYQQSSIQVSVRIKNDFVETRKTVYFKMHEAVKLGQILFQSGNLSTNESFTLGVTSVSGAKENFYKWYFDGIDVNVYDKTNGTWHMVENGAYAKAQTKTLDLMIHKAGKYSVKVVAQNPVSMDSRNYTFTVIENFKGGFVTLLNSSAQPTQDVVVGYGFTVGKSISVVAFIDGKPGAINLVANHSKSSLNQNFKTSFSIPGFYKIKLHFFDSSRSLLVKEVGVIIDWPIVSSIFSIVPNKITYTNKQVTFTIRVFSLSKPRGKLHILSDWSNIYLDVLPLDFQECQPPLASSSLICWTSTRSYVFVKAMRYHVKGWVNNAVSSVQISSRELLVFDSPAQPNPYIEIHAGLAVLGNSTTFYILEKDKTAVVFEQCTFQYGDGNAMTFSPIQNEIEYTYSTASVFIVTVGCLKNDGETVRVVSKARVQIVLQVSNVDYPRVCVLHGEIVNINVTFLEEAMITDVNLSLAVGNKTIDGPILSLRQKSVAITVKQLDYQNSGQISILLTLTNYVSEVKKQIQICVKPAIQQLVCNTTKASLSGEVISFPIKIVSKTSFDLSINYGDGINQFFANVNQELFTTDHIFQSEGTFNYTIRVSNNVSHLWFNSTLEVFQNVPNFTFVSSKHTTWPNSTVQFFVQLSTIPSPMMNIACTVFYGDGKKSNQKLLKYEDLISVDVLLPLGSHQYEAAGCFEAVLDIETDVSSEVLKIPVFINNFEDIKVELDGYKVFNDSNNNATINNNSSDVFDSNKPVRVKILNSPPTCYTYDILVSKINTSELVFNTTTQNSEVLLNKLLNQPGQYIITVHANLQYAREMISNQVFHTTPVPPTLYLLPGPYSADVYEKKFLVALKTSIIGNTKDIATLEWDFGNSSSTVNRVSANFVAVTSSSPYVLQGWYVSYMEAKHVYERVGMYRVTVTGHSGGISTNSSVLTTKAHLDVLISDRRCSRPYLEILSSASTTNNNTNNPAAALITFYNSLPATIPASAFSACPQSKDMDFTWNLYMITDWDYKTTWMAVEKDKPVP